MLEAGVCSPITRQPGSIAYFGRENGMWRTVSRLSSWTDSSDVRGSGCDFTTKDGKSALVLLPAAEVAARPRVWCRPASSAGSAW